MVARRTTLASLAVALTPVAVVCWLVVAAGCGKGDTEPITSKSSKFQVAQNDSSPPSTATGNRGDADSPAAGAQADSDSNAPSLPKPPTRPPRNAKGGEQGPRNRNAAAADPAGQGEAGARPPAGPARVRADKIPDGTADELAALLDQVEQDPPKGRTNRELLDGLRQWLSTRLAICDKLLAADDATEKQQLRAAHAKREILLQMIQAGLPEVDKQMLAFCDSMKNSAVPALARLGRLTDLQLNVAMLMSAPNPETDAMEAALAAALELEPADEELFQSVVAAAVTLQQAGMNELALSGYKAIQTKFANSEGDRIKALLPQLAEMAKLIELKFDELVRSAATNEPDTDAPLLEAVGKLLEGQPSPLVLERLSQVALEMEASRRYDVANKIYEALSAAYKDHPDAEVAKQAADQVASGQRRAGLVGQPLLVEGKTLDGQDFDWKTYEGKVVLVDFWATWCAPCRAELPNIKRNYDKYRDRGFEVVGINLDKDRGDVDQFFSVQKLPWATVVDANELADRCGVESIPFVVLVGRDGRVIDLHVRGELLGKRLAEIFEAGDAPAPLKTGDPNPAPADAPSKTSAWQPATPESFIGFTAADEPAAPNVPPSRRAGSGRRTGGPGAVAAPAKEGPAKEGAATDADDKPNADAQQPNPYLARAGLKPAELVDFLLNMQEKPKSIQGRPGFAEAVVDAAERVLAADTTDKYRGIAAAAKIETLHKQASTGNQKADEQLQQFVDTLKDKPVAAVADTVRFLLLERRVVSCGDVPADKIPELLTEVKDYCTNEKLESRHLRLASSTVEAINRIEDGDTREKYFAEFGKLFAKSSDKELARYGKKLAKAPPGKESDLVGKPLELAGTTAAGTPFNWDAYRGKVVIVDFWATWCGPCVKELPNVKATYEKYKDQGFDIVGVSLDQDQEALAEFLQKHEIPWATLAGDGTQELAQKYGVRGIPTVMLIDREGKVVGVTHRIDQLIPDLEKLLAAK